MKYAIFDVKVFDKTITFFCQKKGRKIQMTLNIRIIGQIDLFAILI